MRPLEHCRTRRIRRPLAAAVIAAAAAIAPLGAQTVRGTVRDTVARRPVRDAVVQIVSLDAAAPQARSTRSDSLGRYAFADVPSGRYLVGFIHPLLDSLGVPPLAREVRVDAAPLVVDLATPEPRALRRAFCGAADPDGGGAVIGVVRDTRREPVAGATVDAEWMELSIGGGGSTAATARRATTSLANGWFFLCGVPAAGTVFVRASSVNGSTDAVPVEMPDRPVARRDLYLGSGTGAGMTVSGVVSGPDGEPVARALVGLASGAETRSNERGEWTIPDAPGGTHTIELRGIGYYPQRVVVDVVEGVPPVHVSLSTTAAILDTVRIRAARSALGRSAGFDQRRRSSAGHFFSAEEVARIAPMLTSDLLRRVPGVEVDRSSASTGAGSTASGPHQLTMSGTFGGRCDPSVFVDGAYFADLDADDIDAFVPPRDVAGVEVYTGEPIPPQFAEGNYGMGRGGQPKAFCGVIAIWTSPSPASRASWRVLAARVAGIAGLAAVALLSFR